MLQPQPQKDEILQGMPLMQATVKTQAQLDATSDRIDELNRELTVCLNRRSDLVARVAAMREAVESKAAVNVTQGALVAAALNQPV